MKLQILFRTIVIAVVCCAITGPMKAADPRVVIDVSAVRPTLVAQASEIRAVDLTLKDGSIVHGRFNAATQEGLILKVKRPHQAASDRVIAYEQIATIRLDLGARRAWRVLGGVLGVFAGLWVGGMAVYNAPDSAVGPIMLASTVGGGYLGTRLGGRQRMRLVIEVR